ncbi:hypothetical protein [Desulfoferrobacter suflitae]|uniref:hypothetical protein n=1 Tax=Desulfoferrobacter suflitae TaxID=2865782 RepID=UPI0021644ED5|nr:hypothetical protein [Desulfoferrobacter suflitae]MCK8603637.1 hypothetical protein [Desulfoferrobacter suflitae]
MRLGSEEKSCAGEKKNVPTFTYELLHGESRFLPGRREAHGHKSGKGMMVDGHNPGAALDQLNEIAEIKHFVTAMDAFEDVQWGAGRGNRGLLRVGMTPAVVEGPAADFGSCGPQAVRGLPLSRGTEGALRSACPERTA